MIIFTMGQLSPMGFLPEVAMVWSSTCPAGRRWASFHLWDFYQWLAMDWGSTCPAESPWASFHLWDFYQRVAKIWGSTCPMGSPRDSFHLRDFYPRVAMDWGSTCPAGSPWVCCPERPRLTAWGRTRTRRPWPAAASRRSAPCQERHTYCREPRIRPAGDGNKFISMSYVRHWQTFMRVYIVNRFSRNISVFTYMLPY
jgi:hypothetical protein